MKLALLGCDDETLALVRGAIAEGDHALVAAYDTAEFQSQVQALAPSARLDEDWETLLLGNLADVVIVARGRLDPSRSTGFAADEIASRAADTTDSQRSTISSPNCETASIAELKYAEASFKLRGRTARASVT